MEKIFFLLNGPKTGWLAHVLWYRSSLGACNGEALYTILFLRQNVTSLMGADAIDDDGDSS